jgi:DNA gyrase/topoisomerase IV subunit B
MLPLYAARIEDLGVGDFVKIDCADDYGRVLNIRSSLQLKISHAASAEETFSTVMGDLVEPSRDFIQANALSVANLDV